MTKNSDITASTPAMVQKVSSNLKRWGFWGFWVQLVLGIISTVLLLLSITFLGNGNQVNPAIQFGILCSFSSIVVLTIALFGFYFRYQKMGDKIANVNPDLRPKKSVTLRLIKIALILNIIGVVIAISGAQAVIGVSLQKALRLSPQLIGGNSGDFVNALDLLIILTNTNSVTSHFAGIIASLLLLDRISN